METTGQEERKWFLLFSVEDDEVSLDVIQTQLQLAILGRQIGIIKTYTPINIFKLRELILPELPAGNN